MNKDIDDAWLRCQGYDGLYDPHSRCYCFIGELMSAPFACPGDECKPGYQIPCTCGCGDDHIGEKP